MPRSAFQGKSHAGEIKLKILKAGLLLTTLTLLGCDSGSGVNKTSGIVSDRASSSAYGGASGGYGAGYGAGESGYGSATPPAEASNPPGRFTQVQSDASVATRDQSKPAANRKLIYNTTLRLVVERLDDSLEELSGILNRSGGFVASNDQDTAVQSTRHGTWVIRVPVDTYGEVLQEVKSLGHIEKIAEKTQDVTDEFVDIEARLVNSRKLEERIIALLEDRSGKLSDILEIERELARVRETIERIEGQLRLLGNKTSLATITIFLREQKEFVPPEPVTYASMTSAAWGNSIQNVKTFLTNVSVGVISFLPWLVVIGPLCFVTWIVYRIVRRRAYRTYKQASLPA